MTPVKLQYVFVHFMMMIISKLIFSWKLGVKTSRLKYPVCLKTPLSNGTSHNFPQSSKHLLLGKLKNGVFLPGILGVQAIGNPTWKVATFRPGLPQSAASPGKITVWSSWIYWRLWWSPQHPSFYYDNSWFLVKWEPAQPKTVGNKLLAILRQLRREGVESLAQEFGDSRRGNAWCHRL